MLLRQLELWTPEHLATPKHAAAVDAAGRGKRRRPPTALRASERQDISLAEAACVVSEFDAPSQYFLDQARTERTRLAYARDCQAFERWCAAHALRALPASVSTLAGYLTQLVQSGKKVSTVRRARIAIGMAHADAGLSRPDRDSRIRALERGMGRVYGTREKGATPLLMEGIERIVATLVGGARDDRDRALLLLGFAGAFRGSELAGLRIENLTFRAEGMDVLLTDLR
jgi:site-specific recombinase XerD